MYLPSPEPILFLIEAFRRSQAMFTAVELKVFDHLEAQPRCATALSEALACDSDALGRLLDTCVALGLLYKDGAHYANSPATAVYLVNSSPSAITGYVEYSQKALWKLWAELPNAVREGTHRWEQVFGGKGGLFSHYYKTEEDKRRFLMGMHAYGLISSPQVVKAFDLSGFEHLVDLGGATGHLPIAACQSYESLKATVFDLPEVLPLAQETIATQNLSDRIATAGGDFFADPLPAGDLYSLGRILHDWTEEKIRLLLDRVYAALPSGGAILLAEKMVGESGTEPLWALLQSLNMLVVTEGKERRFSEYLDLLEAAGFRNIQGAVLDKSPLDAIIAYK